MSSVLVALPNDAYVTPFEHPHVTLGFFGDVDDGAIGALKTTVDQLAKVTRPFSAFTNARSVFGSDPDYVVLVDLITSYDLTEVRSKIERLYGPSSWYKRTGISLDTEFGFLPHMTRGKLADLPPLTVEDFFPKQQNFVFTKIGLWHGDYRYEVAL